MTKPGYKMTEIGEIPEEWGICKFSEIAETVKGSVPKDKSNDEEGIKMYPYLSADYLRDNKKKTQYFKIDNRKTNQIVNMNESILICDGSNAGEFFIGKEGILSSTMVKLVFKDFSVMPKFTYYYMKIKEGTLKNTVKGSTIPHISEDSLLNLNILLPPMKEQQKITDILSIADEAIQKVNEEITLTEKLKKGLMQTLLTIGIGHTKFKMTEMGEIPEEWNIGSLSSVSENENGIVAGPFGSNLKVSDYTNMGIPIIRLQNIASNSFIYKDIKYISEGKAEELNYHSFIAGDIVLAKLGDPIGVSCIIPPNLPRGIVVADVVRIRVSKKKVDKRFVVQSLNSPICLQQLKSTKIGSTRPRVNLSDVRDMKMILPDLQEQEKIAEILSAADNKLELLRNKKTYLERIKKGLMNDLLTGKVRVNINTSEGEN